MPIVALSDDLLSMARTFDPTLSLKYNRYYIGFEKQTEAINFAVFRPR
jgi:hypothetical protein